MWYVKLQFLFNNISISLIFLFDPASSVYMFWECFGSKFKFRKDNPQIFGVKTSKISS